MSRDRRCSRPSLARWGWSSALGLLCLALAACGGAQARQSPTPTTPPPTATINTKGADENTPPPTTPPPPYAFPAAWTNAPGLPQMSASGPFGLEYAFAPSDGRVGYLCATDGHLYATRDGGASWSQLHLSAATGCGAIFIDANSASDLFVGAPSVAQTNGFPTSEDLWRSQDGGVSWSKLGGVQKATDPRLGWSQLAVVGSRLIGAVQVEQEGFIQNGLFVSSDGGATWQHFAQSVANQGYTIGGGFTLVGSAIYIGASKGTSPGGMEPRLWARSSAQSVAYPLAAPLSGQPVSQVFWRSLDGGATWSQVTLPSANVNGVTVYGMNLYAVGQYALAVAEADISTDNQNPLYDSQIWWSANSGATWKRLPDMRGLENGYVIAGGESGVALAPDGSVIATAQHAEQSYGDDAGIFRIQPGAASSAWTPLVAGAVQDWQISQSASGLRLWGVGSFESDTHLKYVNLP
ncbi:MAG TPA: sialidase family protein [Ktedonobacterales bacterium]